MTDGMELMRLLAHLHRRFGSNPLTTRRALTARCTAEDGQERTRVMIFGEVTKSRIAYRKKGKENVYPRTSAELGS